MTCPARIHPLPNDTIIDCEEDDAWHEGPHAGVLVDYAYPGSRTTVSWWDTDRRTFTGEWVECPVVSCTLPANHRGRCAP